MNRSGAYCCCHGGSECAAAHLRLAGALRRRSWSEWYPWVRNHIANPFWASVDTGKVRVAGGEREDAAVTLSDDNGAADCPA